jgi:HK97 family phage major capsid protein
MPLSNQELLQKATLSTADFGTAGVTAPFTIEQVDEFIRLAITPQVLLPEVRNVRSDAVKWQESKIDFASRIMRPGTEGVRLADVDRAKPTTGVVEISTVLIRGEVPVTDEVMEDQVERAGFADTLMAMIAEAVGRDVEELMIAGDVAVVGTDPYLGLFDGWLKKARTLAGAHLYNAAADGQDYQAIFSRLLQMIPDKYKRVLTDFRYYLPMRTTEKYRDMLSRRGTPMGDLMLAGNGELTYQTIPIRGVPLIPITAGGTDTSYILLTNPRNLYAGWHRAIRLEKWRDPREGVTSFVITARVDAEIGNVGATAVASNVDVTI